MTVFELKRRADAAGVDHKTAIKERQAYVLSEISKWDDYINEVTDDIPCITIDEGVRELLQLLQAMKFINHPPPPNEVTQDMIDEVKSIAIDNIVELIHGKTQCFAHEDKSPSAYWAKKVNKLCCPVCNKMWDTIDIKIERDKMDFHSAVRSLHAGNH